MKKILLAATISALAAPVMALDPLPDESGFSGFLTLGAAGGRVESNFLAEIIGIDLGDDLIYELDSPDDTNVILPAFDYDMGYTFDNMKTRVRIGTAVESSLEFTNNTVLAVRHDFDSIGNMELAGLIPSAVPVEVWENPYATNVKRGQSTYTSSGVRFTWDKIFGTGLEFIVNARSLDVDKERSGEGLGLTNAEMKLLDREGDATRIELGYTFKLGGGEHMLHPSITYVDRDLDGKAMAQDGYELGLRYAYDAGDFVWLTRAVYQSLDGDKVNPIFNAVNDADVYVIASRINVPNPLGWDNWVASVGVQWGDNDADIDFNQSSILMGSVDITRKF